MPGIPQGRHAAETGRGSATLVEIDGNGVRAREIALAVVAFETIDVDLAGAASLGERQELIGRALVGAARDDVEVAARLRDPRGGHAGGEGVAWRGSWPSRSPRRSTACMSRRFGSVLPGERLAPGIVAELAALMREDAETTGFRDEALALLDDWRATMPGEVAEALDPAELDAMIAEGLDAVIARLTIEGGPS